MKKWLYVLSVGSLTVIFLVFYLSSRKEANRKEQARLVEAQHRQEEAEAKKAADEKKARQDADEREAKRKADEKAKEEEARKKWDDQGKEIQDDTNGFLARADKASKQVNSLDAQLDSLRKEREKANREAFDSAKLVEKAEVDKETAELRTQYLLSQIVDRANSSIMARPPAPPVAAK
jgi:hypothetical protein